MNKDKFIKEVNKLGIEVTEEILNKLDIYYNFLIQYNSHTNLTRIIDIEEVYLKHFYDSLTIIKCIDLNKYNNLIDIGTGAGFPGMIIKIFYPKLNVTLLDSNNKKITFLKELAQKLNINDITFYHGRVEDFVKDYREKFEIVTGRAVSNLTMFSELCIPLVKVDGYFISMKGGNTEEIEDAIYGIELLGGKIEDIINFQLPIENSERNLIKVKKIKKTDIKYPRRYDKIKKEPLKNKVK